MEIEYLCDVPQFIEEVRDIVFETWDRELGYSFAETTLEAQRWGADRTIPFTLVALEDGHLIGMVSLLHKDFLERPDLGPWLANMYVVPDRRYERISLRLALTLVKAARACGLRQFYFWRAVTSHYSAAKIQFYGYETVLGKPVSIYMAGINE